MPRQAFFMLECDGDEIKTACQTILKLTFPAGKINFVAATQGQWDVIVHASADKNDDLIGPIRTTLAKVRGIRNINTFFIDDFRAVV